MSETIKDGGPAFPLDNWDTTKWPEGTPADFGVGMTLRDWFAGQALIGLCSNSGGPFQANELSGWAMVNCDEDFVARQSFALADAMLAAREGDAA